MRNDKWSKEIRKANADERKTAREARSDKEQLEVLRSRGITSGHEVNRLNARIVLAETKAPKRGQK